MAVPALDSVHHLYRVIYFWPNESNGEMMMTNTPLLRYNERGENLFYNQSDEGL